MLTSRDGFPCRLPLSTSSKLALSSYGDELVFRLTLLGSYPREEPALFRKLKACPWWISLGSLPCIDRMRLPSREPLERASRLPTSSFGRGLKFGSWSSRKDVETRGELPWLSVKLTLSRLSAFLLRSISNSRLGTVIRLFLPVAPSFG